MIWSAYRSPRGKHSARFILLAVYTGTRTQAILALGFMPNLTGGRIDLERGLMYRKGSTERESNKRRKPVKLTRRLHVQCRRWRALGANWAVEINGQRVGEIKHSFEGAREPTGLGDVTPHSVKHAAFTWAMQKGLQIEDAADYFDTSAETIRKIYYHHSPQYQVRAVDILERKR